MGVGRVARWLPWLVAVYVLGVVAVWFVLRVEGDRWWLGSVLLFGPRWVAAAPLPLLAVLAAREKRRSLLAPLGGAAAVLVFPILGFNIPTQAGSSEHDLRVMTYNIGETTPDTPALKRLVDELAPDVVLLQECDKFMRGLAEAFPRWYVHTDEGLCFLSRFPINHVEARDRRDLWKKHGSGAIDRYEIETPQGPVFIQNVHLATVRDALSDVMRRAWKGADKMRANIEQRTLEAKIARAWAEEVKGPLIVAGDFNMPTDSAIYREVWSDLTNGFSAVGTGFGTTKATSWFGIRIDHVLSNAAWKVKSARVAPVHLDGDHRPMVVELSLVTPGAPSPSGSSPTRGNDAREAPSASLPLPTVDAASSTEVKGHPRLWLRAEDVPRLRAWATPQNSLYQNGLRAAGLAAKRDMDKKKLLEGSCVGSLGPAEGYAELFAFLSLIDPDEASRADYLARAQSILTEMMRRLEACGGGDKSDDKLCKNEKEFATHERAQAHGEAFALTTDWIYPSLSADDKKSIRAVFLRWAEARLKASTASNNHPLPIGVVDDPGLVKRKGVRGAATHFFTAHLRNLALEALALDEADDPVEKSEKRVYPRLRDYFKNATGAWLYQNDWVLRNDAAGGLPPEGPLYGSEMLGHVAQTLLALQSAGMMDPAKYGRQTVMEDSPFWTARVAAFLHATSPVATASAQDGGLSYATMFYGDARVFAAPDFIDSFAPMGVLAARRGDASTANAARFIERAMAPGGEAQLAARAAGKRNLRHAILYFLLFDPTAPAATDPRPTLPLEHVAKGFAQIFARTSWHDDATWFHTMIGWENLEHRHGDANGFDFYRKGEWLTKERSGDTQAFGLSDQHNTLTIENDKPAEDRLGEGRQTKWEHGSQWPHVEVKDPVLVASSTAEAYVYAVGDATNVYNDAPDYLTDVQHASRSTLWIKPDFIVLYDRATTKKPDRGKRFWLQTQTPAAVTGNVAIARTPAGQALIVTSLLPASATLTASPYQGDKYPWKLVPGEPMKATLTIDPAAKDADVRFLTILEGADAGATSKAGALVTGTGATPFQGAIVGDAVAMFPVTLGAVSDLAYEVSGTVKRHFVTGLKPGAAYEVQIDKAGDKTAIKIRAADAAGKTADAGGVLAF